jgi:glycerophosphoryl diester phosphodiesterase
VRTVLASTLLAAACSSPAPSQPSPQPTPTATTTEPAITRRRVVAHRGASIEAPENTLAAFRRAWELGAEGIELDVRLSADGAVVVIHDASTKRTGGVDRRVSDQSLAELRSLDVGAWKADRYMGERIPTLAEVLATVPRGGTVFVEIKSEPATAPAVARVIREHDPAVRGGAVALQAYDPDGLAALAGELPGVAAYWTVDPPTDPDGAPLPYRIELVADAAARTFAGLALDYRFVTDDFLAAARAAGIAMDVWTVNDPAAMAAWLGKADVRFIETDRPEIAPAE